MPRLTDHEYLEARQRKCAQMALTATDPGVAYVHREFADLYAAKIAAHGASLQRKGFPRFIVMH